MDLGFTVRIWGVGLRGIRPAIYTSRDGAPTTRWRAFGSVARAAAG